MTDRQLFAERLKSEGPAFTRVIKALPQDKADYRPHPKSRSAGELAWFFPSTLGTAVKLVDDRKVEWSDPKPSGGFAEAATALDRSQAQLSERLSKLDGKAWARKAQFLMGGKVVWEAPLGQMLWSILFDAIHHRGQLSAYIRPMGGKVPSIYGPSGDDPGA
jgi:uncharacterized damage-inducible protein DinB